MAEVRTTSATGGQKGVKPQRYDLLPKEGLDAIAELFGYGAMKYADHNWRNGYDWSKGIAAMERHTQSHKNGETYDLCPPTCEDVDQDWCREHSRLEHLAAVGFHALVGLTWLRTQGEGPDNPFDDRWPAAMERRRREQEAEQGPSAEEIEAAAQELVEQKLAREPGKMPGMSQRWVEEYDEEHKVDTAMLAEIYAPVVSHLDDVIEMLATLGERPTTVYTVHVNGDVDTPTIDAALQSVMNRRGLSR